MGLNSLQAEDPVSFPKVASALSEGLLAGV
jgi:hypothetical protein